MNLQHLFVGVPSHSGQISSEVHGYILELCQLSMSGKLPFVVQPAVLCGISPVQYARNILMGQALASGADRALMIDADMIPDHTVSRLLFSDADIAAARMFRFRHHSANGAPPEIAACATWVRGDDRFDIIPNADVEGNEVQVDACGTGCTMVKRAVLEDPRMRVGPDDVCELMPHPVPAIFSMDYTAAGRITEWEDVGWSLRASRLGYRVVVDFGARCGHRKSINLDAVAELYRTVPGEQEAFAEAAK